MTSFPHCLGVIGGGQLGMLFVKAAQNKGHRTIVYDPDEDSPAGAVSDEHYYVSYNNQAMLGDMARQCDAVTIEFENIPATMLEAITKYTFLAPSAKALAAVQDRIREKRFVRSLGINTTDFAAVNTAEDLDIAWEKIPPPVVLKTRRLGYDGKGQSVAETLAQAKEAFARLHGQACIVEKQVPYVCEISVVLARDRRGETCCFPCAENEHRQGILHRSTVPANIEKSTSDKAQKTAAQIAEGLDYCGVLCVEFFVLDNEELLVNEVAPRAHNSGHYTLDACITSQFDQQVNILCDTPLGSTTLMQPVTMINLLGDLWTGSQQDWNERFPTEHTILHWYGKKRARRNRKMGHFCAFGDTADETVQMAEGIYRQLSEQQNAGA